MVKLNTKLLEKKVVNAVRKKPSVLETKLTDRIRLILKQYTDKTGIKPEIKVEISNSQSLNYKVRVLNGDDEYKARVIEFIKSNLKA